MKTKKPPSKPSLPRTALPRIYRIDAQIASGKYPNSNDLAKMCETSVATISRDIDFMRDQLLAPIEYDRFKRGYYYSKKLYRLPAGFSSTEDILALSMAKSLLTLYRETPIFDAASHLLESITAPLSSEGNKDWLEDRITVPKIASAKVKSEIWDVLVEGLKRNHVITFEYKGILDKDYHIRSVRPYQLLFDSGVWYLYGFSEERKAVRIFSLSRMRNAAFTKEGFLLPKNFRYSDVAGESYFGVFVGDEKYKFVIDCYDDAAVLIAERQWADDQKITEIKDGITIEFSSTQFEKVLRWVLANGGVAIPRKPRQLVIEWKRQVNEIYKVMSGS